MCDSERGALDQMNIDSATVRRDLELTVIVPWHSSGSGNIYVYEDIDSCLPVELGVAVQDVADSAESKWIAIVATTCILKACSGRLLSHVRNADKKPIIGQPQRASSQTFRSTHSRSYGAVHRLNFQQITAASSRSERT